MLKIILALFGPIESSWGGVALTFVVKKSPQMVLMHCKGWNQGLSMILVSCRFQWGEAPWGRGNRETVYLVLLVEPHTMWTQWELKVLVAQSCPTLRSHGLWPARLLCPWNSPGKNTGVAIPFSRESSLPRDRTPVSCIAGSFSTIWATREAHCPIISC